MEHNTKSVEARVKIYKAALTLVDSENLCKDSTFNCNPVQYKKMGVCEILMDVVGAPACSYMSELFPEWTACKPEDDDQNSLWWDIGDREVRKEHLRQCIHMIEPNSLTF